MKLVNLPLLEAEMAAAGVAYAISGDLEGGFVLLEPSPAAQAVFDAHDASKPAPVPVPASVPSAAAKVTLLRAGLYDQVASAVAAFPREVQFWFAYATDWERGNTYVAGIGAQLGLTEDMIDGLFRSAALLA